MKKLILPLILFLAPLFSFAQQNTWTPEQQEQFKKQMDDFKVQMQMQMEQLQDSLLKMQSELKKNGWGSIDSSNFHFEMPEMPEMPEIPEMPEMSGVPDVPPPPPPGVYGNKDSQMEIYAGDDSTEVRVGKWKLTVDEGDGNDHVRIYRDENCCDDNDSERSLKNIDTKFLLFDIGLNNYFASGLSSSFPSPYSPLVPNPGKSWVVNLHLFNQRVNLVDHHLWLTYGAFFEFNSYKYNSSDVMIPRLDSVAFSSSEVSLKKNKLSTTYVGIPLMLRYESNRSNPERSFHIAGGVFGEYLIGSHTKIKTTTNDKTKQHDDFNLNRFRYGVTGRIGYGWASLFVNYSVSELFENGINPVVYPASAGLALEF